MASPLGAAFSAEESSLTASVAASVLASAGAAVVAVVFAPPAQPTSESARIVAKAVVPKFLFFICNSSYNCVIHPMYCRLMHIGIIYYFFYISIDFIQFNYII